MRSIPLDAYVGLRSKNYCLQTIEDKLKAKCKGVSKGYQKTLQFKHYKKCIDSICSKSVTQYRISSKNHQVSTVQCTKLAICTYDDKKYLHPECKRKIHSSLYGSKWIAWARDNNKCPYC